jgi:hypothetical protein
MNPTLSNQVTCKDILCKPDKVVPSLSQQEIHVILMETILEYINYSTPINTLIQLATIIKQYCTVQLAPELAMAITTINALDIQNETQTKIAIDNKLVDLLELLISKKN